MSGGGRRAPRREAPDTNLAAAVTEPDPLGDNRPAVLRHLLLKVVLVHGCRGREDIYGVRTLEHRLVGGPLLGSQDVPGLVGDLYLAELNPVEVAVLVVDRREPRVQLVALSRRGRRAYGIWCHGCRGVDRQ
jgi:hypothetical protein